MNRSDTIYILSSSSDEEDSDIEIHLSYCSSKSKKNIAMKDENKKKYIKKLIVYDEDCIILDYNPFEESTIFSTKPKHEDDDADVSIVSEKGQVACRDFPHSRHLCVKFPFDDTPHHTHCEQCYCYVCDCTAPCEFWDEIEGGHCHASDKHTGWYLKRLDAREKI